MSKVLLDYKIMVDPKMESSTEVEQVDIDRGFMFVPAIMQTQRIPLHAGAKVGDIIHRDKGGKWRKVFRRFLGARLVA